MLKESFERILTTSSKVNFSKANFLKVNSAIEAPSRIIKSII